MVRRYRSSHIATAGGWQMGNEPPAGLNDAARAGDITAIRALADWFRERGNPCSPDNQNRSDEEWALRFDVLAHEFEVRLVQARQLRAALPQVGALTRHQFSRRKLECFFSENGLPLEVFPFRDSDHTWGIAAPADGK